MLEMLLCPTRFSNLLFSIPPVEEIGADTTVDQVSFLTFAAPSGGGNVTFDPSGEKAIDFSSGHLENLGNVAINPGQSPFELSLDLYLRSYSPSTERVIFSQINPQTGGGTYGLTMYNGVGGTGRVSFFWTTRGTLQSRSVITSDRDFPLLEYTNIRVVHTGAQMRMYFGETLVASAQAPTVYYAALPVGIGGHYGLNEYNIDGFLKNLSVSRI